MVGAGRQWHSVPNSARHQLSRKMRLPDQKVYVWIVCAKSTWWKTVPPSKSRCRQFKGKHHNLLHKNAKGQHSNSNTDNQQSINPCASAFNAKRDVQAHALTFPSTSCNSHDTNTESDHKTNNFVSRFIGQRGSGAQVSILTEHCNQMLGVMKKPASLTIHGIGESGRTHSKSTTDLILDCTPVISVRALAPVDCATFRHMSNIKLADPTFGTPGKIDLLLGNKVYEHLMLEGKLKETNEWNAGSVVFFSVKGCSVGLLLAQLTNFLPPIPQALNQLHVTL